MQKKIDDKEYHSRKEFFADAEKICRASAQFNGPDSYITKNARTMVDAAIERFQDPEVSRVQLENMLAVCVFCLCLVLHRFLAVTRYQLVWFGT